MIKSRKLLLACLTAAALVLTACSAGTADDPAGGDDGALDKLTVRLNFTPWSMHNYLYAALDNGYFEDHGLDVEILPAQAGQSIQFVGSGQEDIGITDVSALLSGIQAGAPLVTIAIDQPVSPGAFFFLESSGIKTAKDLEHKKVCHPTNSNMHAALVAGLQKQNVDVDSIEFVAIAAGSEVSLVASGECDVSEGFSYGQPLTLKGQGIAAGSISVGDLGVDLYGVAIFTNKEMLENESDKLTRFLEAIGEGQIWAYQNMTEATTNTLTRAEGRTVPNEVEKVELIYNDYRQSAEFSERWGAMTTKTWQSSIDELVAMDSLSERLDASSVFSNAIIDETKSTAEFAALFKKEGPTK